MRPVIDITGQRFGRLVVTGRAGWTPMGVNGSRRVVAWNVRCDCGNHHVVARGNLRKGGKTASCGCTRLIDLTGRRVGKLTVLHRDGFEVTGSAGDKQTYWACLCDCGRLARVAGYNLRNRHTKSCGCLKLKRKANG
ncbi:hypothetical protein [Bradyrhizobium arachidis]|uniref:hypothetical protein n=1 Tax=Bradyrhizobium arachidis TaxID=858423 RepID=UPI002162D208|nr:hypothetical protein [Bradyrhizobium arachidis]UVO29921.1 hypothetical protein KUF59_03920 [Bradyrhizobium arachidis]